MPSSSAAFASPDEDAADPEPDAAEFDAADPDAALPDDDPPHATSPIASTSAQQMVAIVNIFFMARLPLQIA